ncbi:hypothetical protein DITRI_Ditri01bG0193300 [Diplodiscus trichospermus]
MELHSTNATMFLTFLFLFMVVRILKKPKASKSTLKLPPGPWKLPIIGNMHQLISALPHQRLTELAKKYGPLMQLQFGEVPTVVVSSAEIAEEVMKTNDIIFSGRPYVLASEILSYSSRAIIFTPYGNHWRQMRKICTMELLSPSRVQSFQSIREEEVSDLIKFIASNQGSSINLSEKIFALSYGITARAAFGKKTKGQEEFIRIMSETIKIASAVCFPDMYPSSDLLKKISSVRVKLEKLHQTFDIILQNIVDEHKQKRNKMTEAAAKAEADLVDVLLDVQQHGDLEFPLRNEDIKAVILDMFGGGSETSATTTEWAISELVKNPELMKRAQKEVREIYGENGRVNQEKIHELKFIRAIIKETLRLHPPAVLNLRQCREHCVINGYDIPAKTKVLISPYAIGRDHRYWKDPEEFRPERFMESSFDFRGTKCEYIPFGGGRRICPGITFGVSSIELSLANLIYHFDWKLPNGMKFEDLDMTESFGLTVRRKNDLFLIPTAFN